MLKWKREVCELRKMLVERYGPFLTRKVPPPRSLVNVDSLMDKILLSKEMRTLLGDSSKSMDYIVLANSEAKGTKAKERIAEKHGLEDAFKLKDSSAEKWLSDARRMSEKVKVERETKKRKSIPKTVRDKVWNDAFGERSGVGPCACCNREITQQSFECGHVIAHARGGSDSPGNMRPLCRACNRSMGKRDMDEFKSSHFPDFMALDSYF